MNTIPSTLCRKLTYTSVVKLAITGNIDTFKWVIDRHVGFQELPELQRLKLDHKETDYCPDEHP